LHLLAGDVQILSSQRDGHSHYISDAIWEELVGYVNKQNALWVQATSRMSPQLLIDFLELTGQQVSAYFQSLDPFAMGDL
jgi:hypothetical protein